jgi:hypothetical protein
LVPNWEELTTRAEARYRDGEGRLPDEPDARQRQLTRMATAAYAAGLCRLMSGDRPGAAEWLRRAAERYRESYASAPPGSWGRPIGALKARLLAGDGGGAARDAEWALAEGAERADSPIGRYAGCLALLVLDRRAQARVLADDLRTHDGFPAEVGDALAFIAADDIVGYDVAVESVLESFERRDGYLEDVPVADTVLVLQALAERRGFGADLDSELLPG